MADDTWVCVTCGEETDQVIPVREQADGRWENRSYCFTDGYARLRELHPDDDRFSPEAEARRRVELGL